MHNRYKSKHQHDAGMLRHNPVIKQICKKELIFRRGVKTHLASLRVNMRSMKSSQCIIQNGRRPSIQEISSLAMARINGPSREQSEDLVLRYVLFCSPLRDADATTKAIRRAQRAVARLAQPSLPRAQLIWLHVRAWRAFGSERFVMELGAVNFKTLGMYRNCVIDAALRVWSDGSGLSCI